MRAARHLLAACYMEQDYYDVIDVDLHGSDTTAIRPALDCMKLGGLLFLTSTDGFCSSGKRPERALAAYGAHTSAVPSVNEQGLRMLIGAAVKEAATRGFVAEPLFSLYSAHGPVFRAMLRITRSGSWPVDNYGFVGYSHATGAACRIAFECALLAALQLCLAHVRCKRPRKVSWHLSFTAAAACCRPHCDHVATTTLPHGGKNIST